MESNDLIVAKQEAANSLAEFEHSMNHVVERVEGTAQKVRRVSGEVTDGVRKLSMLAVGVCFLFLSARFMLRAAKSRGRS